LTVKSISLLQFLLTGTLMLCASQGASRAEGNKSRPNVEIVISVKEQRLALVQDGVVVKKFPVSTSRFGIGDSFGSYKTPLGRFKVYGKLGDDLPEGAVFRHRNFSGEVIPANAPGRDPVVTRIIWLEGAEPSNKNARNRCIYIHGTPQERTVGKATSYGCVRMRSHDVVEVFDAAPIGTTVTIVAQKLPRARNPGHFRLLVFGTDARIRGRS
jgi:lipoprotein-anchoring transpeptidase ErfK/SrfK